VDKATLIPRIEQLIPQLNPDAFLVDVHVLSGRDKAVHVLVDTDKGIQLGDCITINRGLREVLEAEALLPDTYALEVSSPGVGSPLKLHRQYTQNIGRTVDVVLTDGRKLAGKLAAATEDELVLQTEKKNPKTKELETISTAVPLTEVKATTVTVAFK
jgi:ribosome maturation factor RimP